LHLGYKGRTHFLVTDNKNVHVFHCIYRAPLMCLRGLSVYIVYNDIIQLTDCNMSWSRVVNVVTGLWAG